MAEESMTKEQERLVKLWDAYQKQEKEYSEALKKILSLEKELRESNKMKKSLRLLVEEKNRDIMELEVSNTSLKTDLSEMLPQIEEKDRILSESKKRYAKLYALTEELEEELEVARKETSARDKWFEENISVLDNLKKTLAQRKLMVDRAGRGEDIGSAVLKLELERTSVDEEIDSAIERSGSGVEEEEKPSFAEVVKEEDVDVDGDVGESDGNDNVEAGGTDSSSPDFSEKEIEDFEVSNAMPEEAGVAEALAPLKGRIDVIKDFSRLDSLNPTLANALYNAGFSELAQIRNASDDALLAIRGFDELRVESLKLDLMDMA